MTLSECATCGAQVCRSGFSDKGPEKCPMHTDFPAAEDLYKNPEEKNLARVAAIVEGDRMAQRRMPELRRTCDARDKYNAAVGGKLLVLSAVP